MSLYIALYCENDNCAVLMFQVEEMAEANCPSCGQFGRKKGKQN